jgi:hypothetical protein
MCHVLPRGPMRGASSRACYGTRRPGQECATTRLHPAPLGYNTPMSDDDDWTGEPPEGHITRDRADPDFWKGRAPLSIAGAGIGIALIILLIVILL